ncbi:acyl-coenzyme A synthetase ACSM3, mitochondrial isoform X2 [Tenrec ecaudatus]|uniref:acyl-coenzyme A synthetase ACSM3, mitochondrial isoform X2 n=1 Tax=Tenrec ecaudatus TaxID=94439 RepID=UPI003F5A5C4E
MLKHPLRLMPPLVTMKILLRAKYFQHPAIAVSIRTLYKDYRAMAPQNFSNYESMKQDFTLEIPEYFNFAKDVLDQWTKIEKAGNRPSHPAFWWIDGHGEEVRWSFEELGSLSRKFANILTEACALQRGDRVITILPRIPEWWLANMACLRTGTVLITGTTQLTQRDILYRLQSSKAKCVITNDALAPAVDAIAPKCEHLNSKLIVSPNPREGWRNLKEMMKNCKFKSLKHCVSAGEPINPEVTEQWKNRTGLDIYEGYGQTETVLVCGNFKGMKIKPGSMGKPSPAFDVKILDVNGNVLPPGQEGDIGIQVLPQRPLGLFTRYVDNPSKTASTLRGNFYITGDRAYMDEDGYFWFVARSDDVILSSGYRIGPFEVESALMEHPAVVESAVVSSPDPIRGEVVKAFIVLNADYKSCDQEQLKKEIQEHVKRMTAPYKYPRKVEFIQELPKTVSGKIKRNELRKKEWGRT